jgi:hypothetical protein
MNATVGDVVGITVRGEVSCFDAGTPAQMVPIGAN